MSLQGGAAEPRGIGLGDLEPETLRGCYIRVLMDKEPEREPFRCYAYGPKNFKKNLIRRGSLFMKTTRRSRR